MLSFDNILEKRIGTGFYQNKTLAIIGLIEFCDGMRFIFMSILITVLKEQWNLTQTQIASLGSIFLYGIFLGNLICAFLVDYIGRKITFVLFTGLSAILVYITGECTNYSEMILLRLFYGITYGTTYPLGFVYISEVTIAKYRGRFALGVSLIYVFGKIYFVLLCFIFLDSYNSGNWQGLIKFNSIPIAISFFFSLFFLNETIRYYLNKEQFQEAFQEIEYVMKQNGQENIELLEEEKQGLQAWQEKQQQEQQEQKLSKFGILSKEYLKQTIVLWLLYILTNVQNMSIYLLMPFLFAHNNSGFIPLLNIFIVEFVFTIIIQQFIDDPKYGGRIKIIIYSAIALIISNGGLYLFKEKVIFIGLFTIKIALRGVSSTIGLACCESYPLRLRSQGNGIASAVSKIASIPSPYFLFPLFYIEPYLPFALMCFLSLLILILAIMLQQDKTQKPLETLKDE